MPAASGSGPPTSPSGGAALPPGHDGPRDQLGHRERLDHRARRPADRSVGPRPRALDQPPARADRLRRRAHPAAHGPVRERGGPGDARLRADVRLRPPPGRLGLHGAPATTSASVAGPATEDARARAHHRSAALGSRGRGPSPEPCSRRATSGSSRCRGAAASRPGPTTRRIDGWSGPRTTGSTGWPAARSPTTPGARTSSDRR